LNYFSQKLGFQYDHQGELARQGNVHENLLLKLKSLAFYKQNPPKSLGIEWVNTEVFPLLKTLDTKDALATFTEHAALQIAHILNRNELKSVFITGGGVYNWYLIEKIKSKTSCEIIIPSDEEIQFKEALIFAFMGVLRMQNQINVLSSATGSEKDHCSGIWLDVI
jgi:anhydro-N-acetylmuramic acid kinase